MTTLASENARSIMGFVDYAPVVGCRNPNTFGEICVQCNHCKRFDKPWLQALGRRCRALRAKHKLPLRKVASWVELTPAVLSRIENGKCSPRLLTFIDLCGFYNVAIEDVLGRDEEFAAALERSMATEIDLSAMEDEL